MGSRTREALFDMLRGWFDGATVIDLFAGVGTLGLEAASRGAARVACVERDRFIARLLRENIETLRCGDRVTVIEADALAESTMSALPRPADVILCDPPFALVAAPPVRGASQRPDPGDAATDEAFDGRPAARAETRSAARDLARFGAMLARLRPLFGERGFLVIRLPEARRGAEGSIDGFVGPEIHNYGDAQWLHLYAPRRNGGSA